MATFYHYAPKAARDSIEQHGLDWQRSDRANVPIVIVDDDDNEVTLPKANYLYRTLQSVQEALPSGYEIYEVDTTGLTLVDDPYEDTEAVMVTSPISPSRLRRMGTKRTSARRQCEQCRGVIPDRMARQRDKDGRLVCEECAKMTTPDWPVLSTLTEHMQAEYRRRAAEALASITRVQKKIASRFYANQVGTKPGKPDEWYYVLHPAIGFPEDPEDEWGVDWDYGTVDLWSGPYRSENEAVEAMARNHGNSGASDINNPFSPAIVSQMTPDKKYRRSQSFWGSKKVAHDSGDEALVHHCPFCFGGKVRYWTKEGLKSFAETVGTTQQVLTSEEGNRTGGFWTEAQIKEFGTQKVWEVTVEQNGTALTFTATGDHIWFVKTKPLMVTEEHPTTINIEVPTHDLAPGLYLSEIYEDGKDSPEGVNESGSGWRIVQVYETDREEKVYCAEVPETHSFALEGNIWTHNCGSGAVTGGSDGSVDCGYCKSVFTVQVQPKHPYAPQTIDGQPAPPPGMPAGQEMELSTPVDQAVEEVEQPTDPTQDPSGAIGPEETETDVPPQLRQSAKVAEQGDIIGWMPDGREIRANVYRDKNGDRIDVYDKVRTPDGRLAEVGATIPARLAPDGRTIQVEYEGSPGYDTYGDPGTDDRDYEKFRPTDLVLVEQHVNNRRAALSPSSRFFTEAGDVLDLERYVDHLALKAADDRLEVLSSVRRTREGGS